MGGGVTSPVLLEIKIDGVWVDFSGDMIDGSLTVTRGSNSADVPFWRQQAGTLSVQLDNIADRLHPMTTTGPFAGKLTPGLPLRLWMTWDTTLTVGGIVYPFVQKNPVFTGWVETWEPSDEGGTVSVINLTAVDLLDRLTAENPPALDPMVGANDVPSNRIQRVADRSGIVIGDRDIPGTVDFGRMQASGLGQTPWSEILLASDCAGGFVWVTAGGILRFRERNAMDATPTLFTDAATPGPGETPYARPEYSIDRAQVINDVRLARAGSTEVLVDDAASIAVFGKRTYARTDLTLTDDADVAALAGWILYQFATIRQRIESIEIEMTDINETMEFAGWTAPRRLFFSNLYIGGRAQVTHHNAAGNVLVTQGFIRGMTWRFLAGGAVTLKLAFFNTPFVGAVPFVIGSSLLGSADTLAAY